MKKAILFIIFLSFLSVFYGQNSKEAIIIDSQSLKPIEFVDVYNTVNYTVTNEDGKFSITSKQDSLSFRRLGYRGFKTTFEQLITKDTIRLVKKTLDLNEVVLKGNYEYLLDIGKNVKNVFPLNRYHEKFFLRLVLRKNGKIVKMQDLFAKLERNGVVGKLERTEDIKKKKKKKSKIELLNMRKAGVEENNYNVRFFSFNEFIKNRSLQFYNAEFVSYRKYLLEEVDYFKINFSTKKRTDDRQIEGYYIVNPEDKAFLEFYYHHNIENGSHTKDKNIEYRTTSFEKLVTFKKDEKSKKYQIDKLRIDIIMEVLVDNSTTPVVYEYSYIMTTKDYFGDFEVNKNVSVSKDMFKLKYPYNEEFWINQKTLLLTDEMREFLDGIENSEYKIRTNFN